MSDKIRERDTWCDIQLEHLIMMCRNELSCGLSVLQHTNLNINTNQACQLNHLIISPLPDLET